MKTIASLDTFTRAYLECALWSSNDESTPQGGEPLDANYSLLDFAPEAIESAVADCARFQAENAADIEAAGLDSARAGLYFWLNRNGHGSGFWDEKMESAGDPDSECQACDRLSEASEKFGEVNPYLGDDKQIYFS